MDENLKQTPDETTDNDILYFDPYKLSNEVLPCFTQSCNSLRSSASIISSISIPDDFEYAGELSRIPAKVNGVANSVSSIAKWLAYDIITPMIEVDTDKNAGIVKGMGDVNYESIAERLLNGEKFVTVGIGEKRTILVKPGTVGAFIKCLDLLLQQHKEENWEWRGLGTSGGLIYEGDGMNTFEDVINNRRRATCCGTYVSMGMYLAGFADKEDFLAVINKATGKTAFNPNTPNRVASACKRIGATEVLGETGEERYKNLEIGDIIVFYEDEKDPSHGTHVQVYGGKNVEGRDIFYSEGSTYDVQRGAPKTPDAPYWYVTEWKAYRLPTDFDETSNSPEYTLSQENKIATNLETSISGSNENNKVTTSLETNTSNNDGNNKITTSLVTDTYTNNYNNGIAPNPTVKKKDEKDEKDENVYKEILKNTEDNMNT